MFRLTILLLFKIFFMSCAQSNAAEIPMVVMERPLRAVAILNHLDPTYISMSISVSTTAGTVCLSYGGEGLSETVQAFIQAEQVESPYVFLPQNCDGCNALRGEGYAIFKVTQSVRYLGYFSHGDIGDIPYENSEFSNIYDEIEYNELTDHAHAPCFEVYMIDGNKGLKVDCERTWEKNQDIYSAVTQYARHAAIKTPNVDRQQPQENDHMAMEQGLLAAAALAKYVGKIHEYHAALIVASKVVPKDYFESFRRIMSQVTPFKPNIENGRGCN